MLRSAAKAAEEELTRQSASLLSLNQTTALIRGKLVTTEEILPKPLPEDVAILDRIRQGVYDSYIRDTARLIRDLKQYVILRFAHEMDLGPDGLLTWSGQPPLVFIGAYRRIVDIFRQEGADKVRWLWSPGGYFEEDAKGDSGRFVSGGWYPGDAYVDFTGFSTFEYWQWEEWDNFRAANHIYRTPEEQVGPRYKALEVYGKPMILHGVYSSGTSGARTA